MNHTFEGIQVGRIYKINGKARLAILMLLLGLGVFLYREALWALAMSVLHRGDSSHGLCMPFISGYFVWLKLEKIKELNSDFALMPGIVMVAAGLLLFSLVRDSTGVALATLSFLLVAAGLVVGLFGKDVFKELSFPLFFLVTMIPLPKPLYSQIAEWMAWATTSGSVWVLKLFHFPIYSEGHSIDLPNMNLLIVESCSGIRHLISYFVFGLAYAFLCKKTIKSGILVVLAAIPMSIFAGVLRLSVIFLAVYYIGPFMAAYRPHILIGWSVFLTVLVGAIWMDWKISGRPKAYGA